MALRKERLTRYTGYYCCPDDIRNFKIRVKYKEIGADKIDSINEVADIEWETKIITWQEKHFSKNEKEFYGDPLNCVSETDKNYHELLKEQEETLENGPNLFTYIEEDEYVADQEFFGGERTYLQKAVDNTEKTENYIYDEDDDEFDYHKHLQSSVEHKIPARNVEKMYILADLGEYLENIWIKNEKLLCALKFDKLKQVLSIYPDFTTTQPYSIKIQSDTIKYFYYFIECCSDNPEDVDLKEKEILKKIFEQKKSQTQRIVGDKFPLPPKNKLHVYLFFEILSAKNFEYPDVFVEYYIDLPEGWACDHPDLLRGRTQVCRGVGDERILHFGHCVDVALDYDIQRLNKIGLPKAPYIYFEIISVSSWDRSRTEGLTYKNLPISEPGSHVYNLSCFRFTQGVWGDLRRFFIGDCKNYKDVTWIGIPQEHENIVINKFGVNTLGTGELNVRVNVVHQSQAFLKEFNDVDHREKLIYEKLSSSSLIKSVEDVLEAFRRARRKMLEVRKDL